MPQFDQLVFSGGGTRCFWQGGFLEATREPLDLQPQRVTGVSGGALSAACFVADCGKHLLENMQSAFENIEQNIDLWDKGPGDKLTPHQRLYRQVVESTLDSSAQKAIAAGPQLQVLLAHPPSSRFPKASAIPLFLAYALDISLRSTPDLVMPQWFGLTPERVDARNAAKEGNLVDLICNAAAIPPVFDLPGWNGQKVMDGALASKAPVPVPDRGRTLLLLTRRFRHLPDHPDRVYVTVSDETPADKLDFTDGDKIERTWQLGKQDGERFLRNIDRLC